MKKTIFVATFFIVILPLSSHSYNEEITHPDLSSFSSKKSFLNNEDNLKNIGLKSIDQILLGKSIVDWIRRGAVLEDAGSLIDIAFSNGRFNNHFHNPLKPWSEAGLSDVQSGESMVLWAQASIGQALAPEGDYSWSALRNFYHGALIGQDKNSRDEDFSKIFMGLGHQIHLIQDSGQPDHVRNDAHPLDGKGLRIHIGYEKWAKDQRGYINSLASTPMSPQVSLNESSSMTGLAPISHFIDCNVYTGGSPSPSLAQGLAEYTNANFFSDDTIFAAERLSPGDKHYFPFPKMSSTNVQGYIDGTLAPEEFSEGNGILSYAVWVKKTGDGEVIEHFLRGTFFTKIVRDTFGSGNLFFSTFYRDEKCHIDYARKLIPRTVGYSAALIDYFFRGKIDLVEDPDHAGKHLIKNNSNEDMDGTFSLYYDDEKGVRRPVSLTKESDWTQNIPAQKTSEPVSFETPEDPKEPGKYVLVFRGQMGKENDAVVGKLVEEEMGSFLLIKQTKSESQVVYYSSEYLGDLEQYFWKFQGSVKGGWWNQNIFYPELLTAEWETEWLGKPQKIEEISVVKVNGIWPCKYETIASSLNGGNEINFSEDTSGRKGKIKIQIPDNGFGRFLLIKTKDDKDEESIYGEPIFLSVNYNRSWSGFDVINEVGNIVKRTLSSNIEIDGFSGKQCAHTNASWDVNQIEEESYAYFIKQPPENEYGRYASDYGVRRIAEKKINWDKITYHFYVIEQWYNSEFEPAPLLDLFPVESKTIKISREWNHDAREKIIELVGDEEKIPNWEVEVDYWHSNYKP